MLTLEIFGFRALWSPFFFIVLAGVLVGYFLVMVKYRNHFEGSQPLTKRQGIYFTCGIILLYAIKGSPLDLMGHLMFYAHMTQMAVLCLIIPILIIKGIPQWAWSRVVDHPVISPIFKFFTKPVIALLFFNGMFSFYHVPLIFDFVKTDMWIHGAYNIVLFFAAIFMFWPLVNEFSEQERFVGLKKVGYIFADGMLLLPACALIIFADTPMYATFSDPESWAKALELCVSPGVLGSLNLSGPEMFNSMSLLHDQQLGGIIMKVIQEIVYGVVLFQVFFSWYRNEQGETEAEKEHRLNPQWVE